MPTLYVTSPAEACWHILRPNERQRVWCHANPKGPTWTEITLHVPASVCPVCREAETASLTTDLDRVPELAGVFRAALRTVPWDPTAASSSTRCRIHAVSNERGDA